MAGQLSVETAFLWPCLFVNFAIGWFIQLNILSDLMEGKLALQYFEA